MRNSIEIDELKFVIATFYRTGRIAIRQLLNIGVPRSKIRVLTYEDKRNEPVIDFLEEKDIWYTTDSIDADRSEEWIREFSPDILCSLYYRDKIPNSILQIPTFEPFNLHPSLLPEYGGVLSIPWAMVNGDNRTGYTYHYMINEIDAGNIICQKPVNIAEHDTAYSLYHRIIHSGMNDFLPTIKWVVEGDGGEPQQGEGSYHFRGDLPNDGIINNTWDDEYIDRFIRAMYFPPFDPAIAKFGAKEHKITSIEEYRILRRKYSSNSSDES